MASRAGVGPLLGYASAGTSEESRVRSTLDSAGWHLALPSRVVHTAEALRERLAGEPPGILVIPRPNACIHEAMSKGWIVLTSRRHKDMRHGRDFHWIPAQRPDVLTEAILYLGRQGSELDTMRHNAHLAASAMTADELVARWADPFVAVVMPLYNDANAVASAIRSVLDQTISDLELVIVDDGSTDDSRAHTIAIDDPRIVRIWQAGRGPSAARNSGLLRISSESYVAFLDSDDLWEPTFLERMIATLEQLPAGIALAFCDYTFSLDGGPESTRIVEDASLPALVQSDGLIPVGAFAFRREVLDDVGLMDEDLARGEDYAWLLRVAARFELVRVPEVLFHYRRTSGGQLMTQAPDLQRLEESRMEALDTWRRRRFVTTGGA